MPSAEQTGLGRASLIELDWRSESELDHVGYRRGWPDARNAYEVVDHLHKANRGQSTGASLDDRAYLLRGRLALQRREYSD